VEAFSFNQTDSSIGFIWELTENFYQWYPLLAKHVESRAPVAVGENKVDPRVVCNYGKSSASKFIQEISREIWKDTILMDSDATQPVVGYFHIRRGDAIKECDTSLERMMLYLSCSFNGTDLMRRNVTVLFSSDEVDQEYRRGIQSMLQELGIFKFIDLDALIRERLTYHVQVRGAPKERLNNFHVFAILDEVAGWTQQNITFRLEQRRTVTCPNCTGLAKRLA
jgi:hypothetical protein